MRETPAESPLATSPRRVALCVFGTLLLVAAANQGTRLALAAATPNIGYALVPQKWRLLQAQQRPAEWLVLGDSSCNQAVDPALLARHLGGEALNLCTVASSLALHGAWMLDWHVTELGPPRAVAAIHAWHLWHRTLEPFAVAHVPLPFAFWRVREPRLDPGPAWTLRSAAARYLPLHAEHRSLARLLARPWEIRARYRVDARGFMPVATAGGRGVEKDARRRLAWLAESPTPRLSPENRAALGHLGALADRHGFDVFLIDAPLLREIEAAPEFRRYRARLEPELAAVVARHPRLHRIERSFPFAAEDMQNADHLLADAAARYTREIAAELSGRLHGPMKRVLLGSDVGARLLELRPPRPREARPRRSRRPGVVSG